jgi:hypothetical protein
LNACPLLRRGFADLGDEFREVSLGLLEEPMPAELEIDRALK